MKSIRLLKVVFKLPIDPWDIPAFRGAIINKIGDDAHVLFHQHIDNGYYHKYPLIQYKCFGKEHHAGIICLNEGTEQIHQLFANSPWNINFKGETVKLQIKQLDLREYTLCLTDQPILYNIYNWLPFSQENYQLYKTKESLVEQIQFLEQMLTGHLLGFATRMEWQLERRFQLHITKILRSGSINDRDTTRLSFSVQFKTNLWLPNFIGLGKLSSKGYGVLKQSRKAQKKEGEMPVQTTVKEVGEPKQAEGT